MTKFTAILYGAPRTKKNHGRRVWSFRLKRAVHVPSESHEAWKERVLPQARVAVAMHKKQCGLPFDSPVNMKAFFYREDLRGDAVGYYQALADLLQEAGAVTDDKYIVSYDGSRLRLDRDNPRIELVLEPARP